MYQHSTICTSNSSFCFLFYPKVFTISLGIWLPDCCERVYGKFHMGSHVCCSLSIATVLLQIKDEQVYCCFPEKLSMVRYRKHASMKWALAHKSLFNNKVLAGVAVVSRVYLVTSPYHRIGHYWKQDALPHAEGARLCCTGRWCQQCTRKLSILSLALWSVHSCADLLKLWLWF